MSLRPHRTNCAPAEAVCHTGSATGVPLIDIHGYTTAGLRFRGPATLVSSVSVIKTKNYVVRVIPRTKIVKKTFKARDYSKITAICLSFPASRGGAPWSSPVPAHPAMPVSTWDCRLEGPPAPSILCILRGGYRREGTGVRPGNCR